MLQADTPVDLVVATGECHSVREFCQIAFDYVGLNYRNYVESDPVFYRPAEVASLVGDASKAHDSLGWRYDLSFNCLVQETVQSDLERLKSRPNSFIERTDSGLALYSRNDRSGVMAMPDGDNLE